MEKTQKPAWKIKGANGKFLSTQGWRAEHEGNGNSCHIALHRDGKVVALIVATGHTDEHISEAKATADEIVAALAAAAPVAAPSRVLSIMHSVARCGLSQKPPTVAFVHHVRRLANALSPADAAKFKELLDWHDSGREKSAAEVVLSDAAAAPVAEQIEPVEYQFRMRPTWRDEGEGWQEWTKCRREVYEDYAKTPLLHDWQYEVRKLYTAPVADDKDKRIAELESALRKFEMAASFAAIPNPQERREMDAALETARAALAAAAPVAAPVNPYAFVPEWLGWMGIRLTDAQCDEIATWKVPTPQ